MQPHRVKKSMPVNILGDGKMLTTTIVFGSFAKVLPIPAVLKGEGAFGVAVGWQLVPDALPPMELKVVRFDRIRSATGKPANQNGFIQGTEPLTIGANTHTKILLDQAYLTNAFTVLDVSGGKGSKIQLTYAESLKDENGDKGDRNAIDGKSISGLQDKIFPSGIRQQIQSLWFRTYRYVQVEITTGDEPLTIYDIHGIFTGYPF